METKVGAKWSVELLLDNGEVLSLEGNNERPFPDRGAVNDIVQGNANIVELGLPRDIKVQIPYSVYDGAGELHEVAVLDDGRFVARGMLDDYFWLGIFDGKDFVCSCSRDNEAPIKAGFDTLLDHLENWQLSK